MVGFMVSSGFVPEVEWEWIQTSSYPTVLSCTGNVHCHMKKPELQLRQLGKFDPRYAELCTHFLSPSTPSCHHQVLHVSSIQDLITQFSF